MNKLHTDFDLPTNHLKGQRCYVPPKARSSTERERRHELPPGSLILEQQHLGAKIGEILLNSVEEPIDVVFVSKILSAAGINTSWYNFGQTNTVMRRRLKLPLLAFGMNEVPLTESDLLLHGSYQLNEITDLSGRLTIAHASRSRREKMLQTELGRAAGNTALSIACVNLGSSLEGASLFMAQEMARTSCLKSLHASRALSAELDYPASLAQLPDPDSDLAVHIRRNAPNNVFEAYDEAISLHAMPR